MSDYGYGRTSATQNYNNALSDNNTVLKGRHPEEIIDPEQRYKQIIKNFSTCYSDYEKATDIPLLGSLLKMDQQIKVGDMRIAKSSINTSTFSGVLPCGKSQPLVITHAFEAKNYVPIADSTFKVLKRNIPITVEEARAYHDALDGRPWPGGQLHTQSIEQKLARKQVSEVVATGKFDGEGKATIPVLPELEEGYEYLLVINSEVNLAKNLAALKASYSEMIQRCHGILQNAWETTQRQAWQTYQENGMDYSELVKKFFEAMFNQLTELYDTVKKIFGWLTNLNFSKLADYLSKEALEELKKACRAGGEAVSEMLIILTDEILVFIGGYAIYSYICMLTPQQIAEFAVGVAGEIVMMILLYIILPGSILKLALDGVDMLVGIPSVKAL